MRWRSALSFILAVQALVACARDLPIAFAPDAAIQISSLGAESPGPRTLQGDTRHILIAWLNAHGRGWRFVTDTPPAAGIMVLTSSGRFQFLPDRVLAYTSEGVLSLPSDAAIYELLKQAATPNKSLERTRDG